MQPSHDWVALDSINLFLYLRREERFTSDSVNFEYFYQYCMQLLYN